MKTYHYFYKITNTINNHFYYGVHSTNNINDGYMGSGTRLQLAYNKYGIENFTKEILKFFDSKEEAFAYEAEVVNEELVETKDCYNLTTGGRGFDSDKIFCKDKNKNLFYVSKDDQRYICGELKFISCGRILSEETKRKIGEKLKAAHNNTHYNAGNKNSQFGTRWIHNDNEEMKIRNEDLDKYLSSGWKIGPSKRIWVHLDNERKLILEKDKESYLLNGWILGKNIQ